MKEVKIIYCYDENKNIVHYLKTMKNNKYFCIDCGAELICRDGNIKTKHLAHKNTENCGGTGESIFHKHWKETLFKPGFYINVANKISEPDNVEILDVLNEVSLNKRYNMNWDIEIIVDILIITTKGDVVVEINYKNPKDWSKLKKYYDQLNLLRVYEIKVDTIVNKPLKWFCLGEKEEIAEIKRKRLQEIKEIEEKKKIEKEAKKLEKEKIKKELIKEKLTKLNSGVWKKILLNYCTEIHTIDKNNFKLKCLYECKNKITNKIEYKPISIHFNTKVIGTTSSKIKTCFLVTKGIKNCWVILDEKVLDSGDYEVLKFHNIKDELYNKDLYKQLCNIK